MEEQRVRQLRTIEALRAGVPNRDVVRSLPPHQSDVQERFEELLKSTTRDFTETKASFGLLLDGDFGTGKTHWLERLEHLSIENNFICSRIVLNKETPLHDLKKIYHAALETARAPDKDNGTALSEIAHTYSADKNPGYYPFREWVEDTEGLDPRFEATLHVFENCREEEVRQKIIADWMGYPMKVGDLRAALKDLGATVRPAKRVSKTYMSIPLSEPKKKAFTVGRIKNDNWLQRFEFMARFFHSAGYAGWVILFDEAEMISKYSLRQRGKAYAHLAQLLGIDKTASVPGLTTAFTITKDYSGQVLYGRKNDIAKIPAKMKGTKEDIYVAPAELGMEAIKRKGIDLRPPDKGEVEEIYKKVRDLYSEAYDWPAPDLESRREYATSTGLRQYLRLWINAWDLRRLYKYEANTIIEAVEISYDEDVDIQSTEETTSNNEPFVTL